MTGRRTGKILAVEATEQEARRLRVLLETLGRSVRLAMSPDEALRLLRREILQEAVVAIELACGGRPLLAHLAALPAITRLVAIGPAGDVRLEEAARRGGAGAYLSRPVKLDALAAAIHETSPIAPRPP